MNTSQKIIVGAAVVAITGGGLFALWNRYADPVKTVSPTNPEGIVADFAKLLNRVEELYQRVGENCDAAESVNHELAFLEKELADLSKRKQAWLDAVPPLPEMKVEVALDDKPGSQTPELDNTAYQNLNKPKKEIPPLPDLNPQVVSESRPGSEVPDLDETAYRYPIPPLPNIEVETAPEDKMYQDRYIPEVPEISQVNDSRRPGSEVPELTSGVPPLPDIGNVTVIDSSEPIYQMASYEHKIKTLLGAIKDLCKKEEPKAIVSDKPKVISDKCEDACRRDKACAAFTEGVTPSDLQDAYDTCMEECLNQPWPKEMIKCMNSVEIKKPNDCVQFIQCQLPQFYENKYNR